MLNRGRFALFAQSATEYSARTVDLVRRCTVIDMLGLLTLDYRKLTAWEADPGRFRPADFLRLKACLERNPSMRIPRTASSRIYS